MVSPKARLALNTNETPVGCVFVADGKVVAKGMNATNTTRNGTRHAEFMAVSALLSFAPGAVELRADQITPESWDAVDPKGGRFYPYGQKLHPSPRVSQSILEDCTLYVTVEPCIMCASYLRQLGVRRVYFGAVNDKFGGTGGVFRIHMNTTPPCCPDDAEGYDMSALRGDGGDVEPGYVAEGGWGRDEAVTLLRQFYVQENNRGKHLPHRSNRINLA